MFEDGFHLIGGNSVANVPDSASMEIRVYDHADRSLIESIPVFLTGGQYAITRDTALIRDWPDQAEFEIVVEHNDQIVRKQITIGQFNYFVRKPRSSSTIKSITVTGDYTGSA